MKRWAVFSYVLLSVFSFLSEASARKEESATLAAQLIEARCTICHQSSNYIDKTHTRLVWTLVVLRMELFNGATFNNLGERAAIVDYLVETRPPSTIRAVSEYFILVLPVVIFFVLIKYFLRKKSAD